MIITNALVFSLDQGFVEKDVYIRDGFFADAPDNHSNEDVLDAKGGYLIPGLVDIHFHGAVGHDFSDGTADGLNAIGAYELENGITSICPASMTLDEATLTKVCQNAWNYNRKSNEKKTARLCGIHLEGPFISPKKKGAQNPDFIRTPDTAMFARLQEAAHGLVKLITIAPEEKDAMDFISRLSGQVHISLGHTDCDFNTAMQAFSLGADHITHFYNAMPAFTHRNPGLIGAGFDSDSVMAEFICDGVHIHPAAIRTAFRQFGKERMILISDTMRAAGMPDGDYSLGGLPVVVHGSHATLTDGTLAGSVTNLMECMKKAVCMGIPLEAAVRAATYNPAKSIGVDDCCGSIDTGKYADCVLLSKESLAVKKVILNGTIV